MRTRKGIIKRVLSLMSAAILTVSMASIGSMAAPEDIIDTSASASLNIYKYDLTAAELGGISVDSYVSTGERNAEAESALQNYAQEGVEFTYLKVGDIHTDSNAGMVKILYDVPADLQAILNVTDASGKFTSDVLNSALAGTVNTVAGINSLEDYISSKGGTAMNLTDTSGHTAASNLALGLYLVVETKVPEDVNTTVNPFFVSLPMTDVSGDHWMYDVTVYPKNQSNIPVLDKLVKQKDDTTFADTNTVSEGDIIDYRITTKLPKISTKSTYLSTWTYVDTMSKGILYNKDTKIAIYDTEEGAKQAIGSPVTVWESSSGKYTTSYDESANTMTVDITATGLAEINPAYSEKYIAVIYTGTAQGKEEFVLGDEGNKNDVVLTYKRTNTTKYDTIKDESKVYSYGINLKKTFSDGKGNPLNVVFKLKNVSDDYFVTASGTAGLYNVTDSAKGKDEAAGTEFSPNADGVLLIRGLEADTYVLTEIKTDAGYSLLKEPVTVVINSTVDMITPSQATITGHQNNNTEITVTPGVRADSTVDGKEVTMSAEGTSANAKVDMSIVNTKDFLLPQTGGMGMLIFTLIGAVVVVIGIAVVTSKGKKTEKK